MSNPTDWHESNVRLIQGLAVLIDHELDAAKDVLRSIPHPDTTNDPQERLRISLKATSPQAVKARATAETIVYAYAVMLVREAERCNEPLPEAGEPVADWLKNRFAPAYKFSFP